MRGNPKIAEAGKGTQFSADNQPAGAGRPKGSRDAFCKAFIDDLTTVWRAHGLDALQRVAKEDPATLVRLGPMLLPKEIEVVTPESKLTDEQLEQIHQMLLAGLPVPEAIEETKTVN